MNLHFNGALAGKTHLIARPPVAKIDTSAVVSGGAPGGGAPPSAFAGMIGPAANQPAAISPIANQPAPPAPAPTTGTAFKSWAEIT